MTTTTTTTATTTSTLGPRPTDLKEISFAPECFEIVGKREVWRIKASLLAAGSSWVGSYTTEEEARKEARGRQVGCSVETIKRRVRWS